MPRNNRRRVEGHIVLASVHRFRQKVAVYASSLEAGTLYLSEDDARQFANAILVACDSVEKETFVESNVPNFYINVENKEQ